MNPIVKAGHRYIGLGYLILGEDGSDPSNDDPELPEDVFRLTIATGRTIDLSDGPADDMRRALRDQSATPGPTVVHGLPVLPGGAHPATPTIRAPQRRRRGRREAE